MRRRLLALQLVASALSLGACGQERRAAPALAPVRLSIDGPADAATVEIGTVEVHGRVDPATARVLVDGDEADVRDGAFSLIVPLRAGANVVDVQAGAPRHPAAMTALRVTRQVPVEIPTLAGAAPDDAVRTLERLGLRTEIVGGGGPLDFLIPGSDGVCATEPAAGERVRSGSRVRIQTSKGC